MNESQQASEAEDLPWEQVVHRTYLTAIRLLARRDHSVAEITHKLQVREHDEQAIEQAVEELLAQNYLNDQRYAAHYAEHCVNRGHGPLSIKSRMVERGIDDLLAGRVVKQLSVDWSEQAEEAVRSRFSSADICDTEQRATARIARFLQRRGYSASDSLRALNQLRRELDRSGTN